MHALNSGGWHNDWLGLTPYSRDPSRSRRFGHPSLPHRVIIADFNEGTLIHELAHQLNRLAWSETGPSGEAKASTVETLYKDAMAGKGSRPVTSYARTGEAEYFAESFRMFLMSPIVLKARDPMMFDFMNTQVLRGKYP
jgi:hypothetical protein